ncbi:Bug family tripartite tricarboxylate transporter substrate binding protein [Tardiphaga sp. 804_B3_N1_9]|uniref:Bug family tripartite tricarboxylate transporter substrate binding protein n=1 Tax=Tardiphaga TaxID=1395974 RepID=UPI0015869F52|nr:tripartite tricarboxylate transporter substrate binding protein [Tardiphaga robiniae]NUU43369.1 tripartite tricarboxylate transporter substrate binding protein [Tardiphaga robiniae]
MKITRRSFLAATASTVAFPSIARSAADTWPQRPIRIVVGFAPGGQTDVYARMYAEFIGSQTGVPVIVENKTGALGSIAGAEVKRAAPDGYTILFNTSGAMTVNRVLVKDLAYDTDKDFQLVSAMPTGGLPLITRKQLGITDLDGVVRYARATGRMTLGTFGVGSPPHLTILALNKQYGLNIEPIHYRGEAPMFTDMLAQTVDGGIGTIVGAQPVLQSGAGAVVAVPRKRLTTFPEVRTFAEQGADSPLFGLLTYQCCAVPTGTPTAIAERLSDLIMQAAQTEKVRTMFATFGIDEGPMSMQATRELYAREAPIWVDLAKQAIADRKT